RMAGRSFSRHVLVQLAVQGSESRNNTVGCEPVAEEDQALDHSFFLVVHTVGIWAADADRTQYLEEVGLARGVWRWHLRFSLLKRSPRFLSASRHVAHFALVQSF